MTKIIKNYLIYNLFIITGIIITFLTHILFSSNTLCSEWNYSHQNEFPEYALSHSVNYPSYNLTSPLKDEYIKANYKKIFLTLDSTANALDDVQSLYLIAKSYKNTKDYKSALKYFSKLKTQNSPVCKLISDHIDYNIGVCQYRQKNYKLALYYFQQVRKHTDNNFPLLYSTLDYEAKCLKLLGQTQVLVSIFSNLSYPSEEITTLIDFILAKNYYKIGKLQNSLLLFEKLIVNGEKKYYPLILNELKIINKKYTTTPLQNYLYGILLIECGKKKKFDKAFMLLSADYKIDDVKLKFHVYKAIFKYHMSKNDLQSALSTIKTIDTFNKPQKLLSKYYQLYIDYYSHLNIQKVLHVYIEILNRSYSLANKQISVINKRLINYFISNNQLKNAQPYLISLAKIDEYKYIFDKMKLLISKEKWQDIITYFPLIIDNMPKNRKKIKFLFYLGLAEIKLNKVTDGIDHFKEAFLTYTNSYYSWQAYYELTSLSKLNNKINPSALFVELNNKTDKFFNSLDCKKRMSSFIKYLNVSLINDPNLNKAVILFSIGDNANGYKEWMNYYNSLPKEEVHRYYLVFAELFRKLGLYQYQIRYANKAIKYINNDGSSNYIPSHLFELAYPKYFKDTVQKYAKENNIDEYLIYATIRQESSFFPLSKSWAGAIGLMQIMPATGRGLEKGITSDDLFDVERSIRLGSKFLSSLIRQFNSPAFALAGYNWGPGRVRRLLKKRKPSLPLQHESYVIESIKVNETRNYVKIVLSNYYNYLAYKTITK